MPPRRKRAQQPDPRLLAQLGVVSAPHPLAMSLGSPANSGDSRSDVHNARGASSRPGAATARTSPKPTSFSRAARAIAPKRSRTRRTPNSVEAAEGGGLLNANQHFGHRRFASQVLAFQSLSRSSESAAVGPGGPVSGAHRDNFRDSPDSGFSRRHHRVIRAGTIVSDLSLLWLVNQDLNAVANCL